MRIRGVGHACLDIEMAGLRILTDPWWAGPAYCHQWHPWPAPQPGGLEKESVDYLYLSHGHADHLHEPTLRRLAPGATALVPELLAGRFDEYLRGLGFEQILTLSHGKTVPLRNGMRATCYLNMTDSLLVLDDGRHVIIDGNDALHASPAPVIDHFCHVLASRYPFIDVLFLGYGGASWFPNCARLPGKDDVAQARRREDYFVGNFLRVVDTLRPKLACPFATSFVLLEPHNRWINDVRLDLPGPDEVHASRGGAGLTECHLLLPGDVIENATVTPGGMPRPSRAELAKDLAGPLRAECERLERLEALPSARLHDFAARMDERLRRNRPIAAGAKALSAIELRLRDNPGFAFHLDPDARGPRARLGVAGESPVALEMRAEILDVLLGDEYGSEAITIGYGALAHLQRPENLDDVLALIKLLRPRPAAWRAALRELRQRPLRSALGVQRQIKPLAMHTATRLGLLPHNDERAHLR